MSLDTIELETSGKGEKIDKKEALVQLADIQDVKKYLEKLSARDKENRLRNPEVQKQVILFLETAANNTLPKHLEKFNAKKFDTDGESGLDQFEFEEFATAIKGAIQQIVALDGIKAFDRTYAEAKEEGGWSSPDKWVAEKADLLKLAFGEGGITHLTDDALKRIGNLSDEELHKMSEKIFSPKDIESWKELAVILAKELGNGVEGLLKFVSNIPAGVILLPRYMSYRVDSNSSDIEKKTEGEIKLAELVEENSSLAVMELLGEKGVQMVKDLGSMMKSGKQGDIAKILVTIAGLITGGAGIVKFMSSRARKVAVNNARKAGFEGRTIESRAMRNGLKEVSKTAGKVAEVAGKVDNIVSGNAIIGKGLKVVSSGVTKVAPAFVLAANDTGNIIHINRANDIHHEAMIEEKATGTYGPSRRVNQTPNVPTEQPVQLKVVSETTDGSGHVAETATPNNKAEQAKNRTRVEKSKDLPTATKLNEDIANEAKTRGVDENIVRKERLVNNEGLSGEQADRVIAAHAIRREGEGLGKYGITSLKEKIQKMTEGEGGLTVDQARNMLKKGYAGVLEDTENLLNAINKEGGTDFLKLAGKNINQAELNALVVQLIENEGADIAKLDKTIRTIFEISGYAGDTAKMYAEAIRFAKELKATELIRNIRDTSAQNILKYISTEGAESSENLIRAFLKDGSKEAKTAFFQALEGNDTLRNNLLTGKASGEFIRSLGENYQTQTKLITSIISDEGLLKILSSDALKHLDAVLQKMIQEKIVRNGFDETLRTKLALAQDASSPANRVAYFLKNGDEQIADLLRANTPEKREWSMRFNELRTTDNGIIEQLNMIKRGEPSFFYTHDLDSFFNMNFVDLEKGIQKEFIRTHVVPTDGKYHSILETFPTFRGKLEKEGLL